jgi:addiction module HigA family antidote
MADRVRNKYTPDTVSPPGETLLETIEALDMSQVDLADRMGRPYKTINEIIKGKASITPETAIQLERVLGAPARFWLNREQHYREFLARQQEKTRLQEDAQWLAMLPVMEMVKLGWIKRCSDKVEQIQELLNFFGVASPQQWRDLWLTPDVVFRRSQVFVSDPAALSAWLRKGELQAQSIVSQPYKADAFRNVLAQIRKLTVEPPEIFAFQMVQLCAQAGVAVAFTPQLSKTPVSGATRWLSPEKALIQLSLRFQTDDHFWFSFYHKAGHILLHGKRDVFIEDEEVNESLSTKENEANSFAADILIEMATYRSFLGRMKPGYINESSIRAFASELEIAPGIVVGRLQHDKHLAYTHCNKLKRRFAWATTKV